MPQLQQFSNNTSSILAASISSSSTTCVLEAGTGSRFPTITSGQFFICTLIASIGTIEIIRITYVSGDTFTITRGQEGTTPSSFNPGDVIALLPTAQSYNNIYTQVFQGNNTYSGNTSFLGTVGIAGAATLGTATVSSLTIQNITAGSIGVNSSGGVVSVPRHYVGEIFDFTGPSSAVSTNCPGAIVLPNAAWTASRTTYAALFSVIGTTWGAGDGSTTFGMPYVPGGYATANASTSFTLAGATAGANIAHTHSNYDSGHAHGISDPSHGHGASINIPVTDGAGGSVEGILGASVGFGNIEGYLPGNIGISNSQTGIGVNVADANIQDVSSGGSANYAASVFVIKCLQVQ